MKNALIFAAAILSLNAMAQENVISFKLGSFTVSTLSEGQQNGKTSILIDAPRDILEKYAPDGTCPGGTNAFLIRTPDKTVLVDTGLGKNLFKNLETLGVAPESVEAILVTHMHGDHTGGMLKEGKPAFPNAEVYIARAEYDYWTSDEQMNLAPEGRRSTFLQAKAVAEAYKTKLHLFTPAVPCDKPTALFEGVGALDAHGHTPGHTAYLIESEGAMLMIIGDLIHCVSVQMPHPEIAVSYDSDPKQAIAVRKQFFDYVAYNGIRMAGMHIPFPGTGRLSFRDAGFSFSPLCSCEGF